MSLNPVKAEVNSSLRSVDIPIDVDPLPEILTPSLGLGSEESDGLTILHFFS